MGIRLTGRKMAEHNLSRNHLIYIPVYFSNSVFIILSASATVCPLSGHPWKMSPALASPVQMYNVCITFKYLNYIYCLQACLTDEFLHSLPTSKHQWVYGYYSLAVSLSNLILGPWAGGNIKVLRSPAHHHYYDRNNDDQLTCTYAI